MTRPRQVFKILQDMKNPVMASEKGLYVFEIGGHVGILHTRAQTPQLLLQKRNLNPNLNLISPKP